MKNIALALVAMIGFSGAAFAQGDAAAGETKSVTCVACHGEDGNSPTDMYPKLAGQHAKYLEKQLNEYKLGMETAGEKGRNDPIMAGMVAGLTPEDMADLAAYFGNQAMSLATTPADVVDEGQKLYMGGDAARGIPACTACHGPRGEGTELAGFPKISSQHPAYIKSQLELFRSGERHNDMNGMMGDIAVKLTDNDIAILSKYIAGLH